jgi:hypothetical protein
MPIAILSHGTKCSEFEDRQCVNGYQRRDKLTARSTNRSSIAVVVVTENRDSLKNKSFVEPPLFRRARHEPLLRRVSIFAQTGVYRQPTLGNLGLVAAMVLNKI